MAAAVVVPSEPTQISCSEVFRVKLCETGTRKTWKLFSNSDLLGQKGQNFCIFTKFCRLPEPFPIQNSKHTKTSSENWPLDSTMLHVDTQNGVFSALRSAFKHIKGQKKSDAIKYCLFYQCRHYVSYQAFSTNIRNQKPSVRLNQT